jgi:MFS-type transporter involved in bile tolerance (Atg22 family)
MLDRYRGGEVLAIVNGLMGLACLIPALIVILLGQVGQNDLLIVIIFISGMLFGLAFITAVSSTTAFIKHNYPVTQWSVGIRLFTILFAIGQMLGPLMIGYIADYGGGLIVGLIVSGMILFLGSLSALQQRPLKTLNITKPSR